VFAWWRSNYTDAICRAEVSGDSPWTQVTIKTPGPTGKPWERRYAIWNETGALHRVDQHGAVADEPIEVEALP